MNIFLLLFRQKMCQKYRFVFTDEIDKNVCLLLLNTGRLIQDPQTINYILELHNEVRSKVARGRCGQPIAGCMRPLQWDPELARVAQKWADQCVNVDYKGDKKRKDPFLFHDKHADRKTGQFKNARPIDVAA